MAISHASMLPSHSDGEASFRFGNRSLGSRKRPSLLRCIGQPLNHVLAARDTHDRHTGDFAYPPLQIAIVGGDNVDPVLQNAVDETVVGIDALVVALEAFPSLVSGDAQCDAVLGAELLEFGHDAVGNDGNAFGVEAVHHRGQHFELLLNRVGDEVGVDQDGVGRYQSGVVLEE
jgi:hypothetical protein